jgi:hypothetical protein
MTRLIKLFFLMALGLCGSANAVTVPTCYGCNLESTQTQVAATVVSIRAQAAREATLQQAVTHLTTLVNQLTASGGAAASATGSYADPALTDVLITCTPPAGAVVVNAPAEAAILAACTAYTTTATKVITAHTQFVADMTALKTQFQSRSTPAATTAGTLTQSLQVQALQGLQDNLIGRYTTNLELLKLELEKVNASLKAVRKNRMYGK